MGTKWNDLEINKKMNELAEDVSSRLTPEDKEAVIKFISKGMTKEAISYLARKTIESYPEIVKEFTGVFSGVRFFGNVNTVYGIATAIVWYFEKQYENRPDAIGYNTWVYNETGMDINYLN